MIDSGKKQSLISTKFKTTTRGLDVIQAVYAFAMALGLTQIFTGSRTFLIEIVFGAKPFSDEKALLIGFLFLNVLLLGLRFFWVPRNLNGLVFVAAQMSSPGSNQKRDPIGLSNLTIAIHMVMIFMHGALFFLLGAEFEFVVFITSSNLPLEPSIFTGYILMHVCLLLMNAAWIGYIKYQEVALVERVYPGEGIEPYSAGSVWWRNNLIASLLAIAPLAIAGTCQSDIAQIAYPVEPIGPMGSDTSSANR